MADSLKQPLTTADTGGEEERFKEGGRCQDGIWVPLFLLQLIAIIGLSGYYYSKNTDIFDTSSDDTDDTSSSSSSSISSFVDSSFWTLCGIVIVVGICSAALWILFIRRFSYCLIWFSLILTLTMWIIFAIIGLILNQIAVVIIAIICALLQALWMYCVRDRIAFAAAVLEMAVTATNEFGSCYLVSFLSIFVQALWMIIWVMGFSFVIYDGTKESDDTSSSSTDTSTSDTSEESSTNNVSSVVVFLFLVSFYWTAQVIANVVHVTSAGVVASWYFLFPHDTPKHVVSGALKRAMTSSFGSICFGSFLIAVIQAVRAMVRSAQRSNNGLIVCCIGCILGCIESILEYFNFYAFTRVAIYGLSFCQAAKETWQLFKSQGFDIIINDDLTSAALSISCIFAGLMSAAITALLAYYPLDTSEWYAWAIVAFIIGYGLALCALVVVRSGVATIFVAFAEEPAVLAETKPEHYEKITTAWRARYGEVPESVIQRQAV